MQVLDIDEPEEEVYFLDMPPIMLFPTTRAGADGGRRYRGPVTVFVLYTVRTL